MTESQAEGLVNLSEIAEIELFILKRMKEFTLGDHTSVFKGSGVNFVGLRDWEPGDRLSSIDFDTYPIAHQEGEHYDNWGTLWQNVAGGLHGMVKVPAIDDWSKL